MTLNLRKPIKDFFLENLSVSQKLAKNLAPLLKNGDILTFQGNLGAGKTEFCRSLIHALGFDEDVPSPTFNLVQIYEPPFEEAEKVCVWHMDLYRLESPEEIFELGIEDAFDSAVSLIEWPDRMGHFLPDEHLDIILTMGETEGSRNISFNGSDYWEHRIKNLEL